MQLQDAAQVLRVLFEDLALVEQLDHISSFVFCKVQDVLFVEVKVFNEEVDDLQGPFLDEDLSFFLEYKFLSWVLSLETRLRILLDKIIISNLVLLSYLLELLIQRIGIVFFRLLFSCFQSRMDVVEDINLLQLRLFEDVRVHFF